MTYQEMLKQLESVREHSADMARGGDETGIWERDVEALDMALTALRSGNYPCVHDDGGRCKKFSDDKVVSYCVEGPCTEQRMSNADRIRAMSDEELARKINTLSGICGADLTCTSQQRCQVKLEANEDIPDEWCLECALKWLQQPAEEGEHE